MTNMLAMCMPPKKKEKDAWRDKSWSALQDIREKEDEKAASGSSKNMFAMFMPPKKKKEQEYIP